MADPIQELMDEHRVIEKVLSALERAAERDVPFAFYERAVDFIARFADECHHGKEEERLFPVLERKGVPREGGPIGVMCAEHEVGRGHVARMRALIAAEDRDGLRRESLAYAGLLRDHIRKEDEVLFPMGRSVLDAGEIAKLTAAFREVEERGGYRERYAKVAEDLLAAAEKPA